jgi:hypothetical protein
MDTAEIERRIRWIEHKGKRILLADFSGLVGDQGLPLLDREAMLMQDARRKVLVLVDLTNGIANEAFLARARTLGKAVFMPNSEKRAIVGVTGFRGILLTAYTRFIGTNNIQRTFATVEEAKDWLVS